MEPIINQGQANISNPSSIPNLTPDPVIVSPEKKKHPFSILISILVLIIISAAAAFAAGIFSPNSPEKIVKDALDVIKNSNTIHSSISINASTTGIQDIKFVIEADADKVDINNIKLNGKLNFSGLGFVAGISYIMIENTSYFKVDQLPLFFGKSASEFTNKWFSLSKKDIEDLSKLYGGLKGASSTPLAISNSDLSSRTEFINNLMKKYKLYKSITYEGSSTKNGQKVKTYKVVLDKDAFYSMYEEIVNESIKTQKSASVDKNIEEMKQVSSKMIASTELSPVIIEIGSDGIIKNVNLSIDIDTESITKYGNQEDMGPVHLDVNINYSAVNKPLSIIAPTVSEPLINLIKGSLEDTTDTMTDSSIKSSFASMYSSAEIYFNNNSYSYAKLCQSTAGMKMIKYLSDKGVKASCIASSQAYSISAPLSNGKYYCIDSTGKAISQSSSIISTSCK